MFIVLIIFIIMDRVDIVTLIIGDGIGNVAKFDLWPPVFFYKGKLYSLVCPAYAFVSGQMVSTRKNRSISQVLALPAEIGVTVRLLIMNLRL